MGRARVLRRGRDRRVRRRVLVLRSREGRLRVSSVARGVVALAAFVLLALLVALGALANVDGAVLDAIQRPRASWLDLAASVVTVLGQSEVIASVALGIAVARLRRGRGDWWIPLLVAVVVAIEVVLKIVITQGPPPHELSRSIKLLPFLESPTPYAFPSGHVARVAFLVVALRWPSLLAAGAVVLVALTRIYLAEHWPSDVVGGWLLGYGVATMATSAARSTSHDRRRTS